MHDPKKRAAREFAASDARIKVAVARAGTIRREPRHDAADIPVAILSAHIAWVAAWIAAQKNTKQGAR